MEITFLVNGNETLHFIEWIKAEIYAYYQRLLDYLQYMLFQNFSNDHFM